MQKILFVPIEVRSRDYFPRLLISLMFASKGFDVYFGRKREIELMTKFYTNSFYLGLQTTKTYLPFYKKLKKNNFKVLAYDEEGLVTLNDETYISTRASDEILNTIDFFLCWGDKQFNLIKKNTNKKQKKKILNLGNPRIDILKKKYRSLFQKEINEIGIRDYTLINMTFGHANHFLGGEKLEKKLKSNNFINNKKDEKIYTEFRNYKKKRFLLFNNTMLNLIKNNPNEKFVIRPHPSENSDRYNYLKKYPNVLVTKKYNVIPWILRSKLVLSDYCTTSIEAKILGVPSVSYKVPKKIHFLDKTFFDNSIKLNNFLELNSLINRKKLIKSNPISSLKKRLININDNFFSSKKLFDHIIKSSSLEKKKSSIKNFFNYINAKFIISFYLLFFKNVYAEEKCKNISKSNLKYDVERISNIEKYKKLNIKKTCPSVYRIFK
mgnify:CR=1 FL=1|tara:strand:+ start:32505 stop:33815 length:1311 start_codon:yes stop_codon:yes gene_type:complete